MRELPDGKKRSRVLLVSRVAHDFNNLLMVVHGSAEALCRRVPLTDKAKLYADAINHGGALLIEDNPEVAQVVAGMLSDVRYTVSASGGASAAYKALQTEGPFGLVLSDIVMEGVSGLEIAREIRARYATFPSSS